MTVLLGYLGVTLVLILAIAAPMLIGRRLSDRQEAVEAAEIEAIEASALARLAGLPE